MSIFYLLLIAPIGLVYKAVLLFSINVTENHFLSLVILSCVHTILFIPFRQIASSFQEQERKVASILTPRLAAIKAAYSGKERHLRISRLYERYGYNPILAVRSAFGILMQVPFIVAAFYMLSELSDIKGKSTFLIADLSQPDGLLGQGLNLLPIVMTLFNFGTTFTSKNMGGRERIQASTIAVFFLVLLYHAPAALMIFWTTNNLIGFLQNFSPTLPRVNLKPSLARRIDFQHLTTGSDGVIYLLCSLILVSLVTVYSPSMLYFSDPQAFDDQGIIFTLRNILPVTGVFLLFFGFVWQVASTRIRPLLTLLAIFMVVTGIIFTINGYPDYGVIDGLVLVKYDRISKLVAKSIDSVSLLFAAGVVFFVYRKRLVSQIKIPLLAVVAAILLYPWYQSVAKSSDSANDSVASYKEAFKFSANGQNVMVLILDAFTSSYIDVAFQEEPALRERYAGFTWYPNTLAAGSYTIFGLPAILGGHEATAIRMNRVTNLTNLEKVNKAYAALPGSFAQSGFDVNMINEPKEYNSGLFFAHSGSPNIRIIRRLSDYYTKKGQGDSAYVWFPVVVGLFKVSPNQLRRRIYDRGRWMGVFSTNDDFVITRNYVKEFLSLPNISSVDSEKNTFKVYYNKLSHAPFFLMKDKIEYSFDPYPETPGQPQAEGLPGMSMEHHYTQQHMMRFIANYFDWMRANAVYDNTRIIMVSDHSWYDAYTLNETFGGAGKYFGRPLSLLMVKDFNERKPFNVSNRFMSTADVPFLACQNTANTNCGFEGPPNDPSDPDGKNRVLYHSHSPEREFILGLHPENRYRVKTMKVTGNLFNAKNWESVPMP